jgi:hypothetical protein
MHYVVSNSMKNLANDKRENTWILNCNASSIPRISTSLNVFIDVILIANTVFKYLDLVTFCSHLLAVITTLGYLSNMAPYNVLHLTVLIRFLLICKLVSFQIDIHILSGPIQVPSHSIDATGNTHWVDTFK